MLLVLSIGYHAQSELKGLLAGSGVAAIIPRVRRANLLSGIVAGMSLQIERPYKVGDWLRVGDMFGEVTDIEWGGTRLRTNDAVYLHIPNNEIVKQTIVNLHYPTALHAMRLTVGVDYAVSAEPGEGRPDALRDPGGGRGAGSATEDLLKEFGDSAVVYEVKFWMTNHAAYNDICDAIRTNIWYEFKRRKITIPFPIPTLQVARKSAAPPEEA